MRIPSGRRPVAVAAVAGLLLVAGGGLALAQGAGTSGHYRTATAEVGDVDSTLSLSGTVSASSRRDLTFGTDGDVTKVLVESGDEVEAGDTLATLDPEDLDAAVIRARATLAKARAQLESDQSAQSSTVSSAASTSSTASSFRKTTGSTSSAGSKGGSGGADTSAVTEALAELSTEQDAVTAAQTAATDAITAAKSAVSARADACQDVAVADPDDPDAVDAAEESSQECATALAAAQDAQDVVAAKQDALQSALEQLTSTLTAAVEALGSAGSSSGGSASGGSTSTGSTPSSGSASGSSSGSSGGSGGGTVSAATLAQDQAAIDTAKAALTEAKRARDAATLTAPFDGTVLDVSVAKGDAVSSTDVAVILVGDGGSTVSTSVTVDQVDAVEKGQTAQVTPAGFDEPVEGTVTAIGMLPTSGDDATTYPVTIALADDVSAPEGAGATISLVTGTAKDAITVPSSAVTTSGSRSTVTVLRDGEPTRVAVTVGVVGSTRTSITEGLDADQEVVLADLDAALPSSDSDTGNLNRISGGGGPGGGGFGGGGGQGGPPSGGGRG